MSLQLVKLPDSDMKRILTFVYGVGVKSRRSNDDFYLQMT
jgi:hypothetical protein